jgi:hypothetical protein
MRVNIGARESKITVLYAENCRLLSIILNTSGHYSLGANPPFKVRTDHAAILWLRRIHRTGRTNKRDGWRSWKVINFVVEHRAGARHGNADAMSHDPCHNKRCCPKIYTNLTSAHSSIDVCDSDALSLSHDSLNARVIKNGTAPKRERTAPDCDANTDANSSENLHDKQLAVGQEVWYLCPRRYKNRTSKWQRCFTGPYTIIKIVDSHVFIIKRHNKSKPFAVHRDKLKPVVPQAKI